jgi:hypothetical protein
MIEPAVPSTTKKRILTLDGGGIRGLFSIEVLARMEQLLREHYGKPVLLSDHFHMIAGTSTGAIIGTFLACGGEVSEVRRLYIENATAMFRKAPLWKWHQAKFRHHGLSNFLKAYFREENGDRNERGEIALLGSPIIKTRLLLVMRNATTGASWPISNNPKAKFNRRFREDGTEDEECNLLMPLWQLVRASAAAPWFFPPETILLGKQRHVFVDGAITPYNNPSLIAYLMATLPCYGGDWETGTDRLHLVSIGTGRKRTVWNPKHEALPTRFQQIGMSLSAFADTVSIQQDFTCRVLGECRFGDAIDSEIGDLIPESHGECNGKKFSYVRYNRFFPAQEVAEINKTHGGLGIDNLRLIPFLQEVGRAYAREHVKLDHLL